MTTKPIVVGADGSAEALRAVEWAAREAALRSAPLRIVSAAEILPQMTMPPHAVEFETVAARIRQNRDWALTTAARAAGATAPDAMKERASAPGGCWKLRSIRLHQAREAHDDGSIRAVPSLEKES